MEKIHEPLSRAKKGTSQKIVQLNLPKNNLKNLKLLGLNEKEIIKFKDYLDKILELIKSEVILFGELREIILKSKNINKDTFSIVTFEKEVKKYIQINNTGKLIINRIVDILNIQYEKNI